MSDLEPARRALAVSQSPFETVNAPTAVPIVLICTRARTSVPPVERWWWSRSTERGPGSRATLAYAKTEDSGYILTGQDPLLAGCHGSRKLVVTLYARSRGVESRGRMPLQ